MSFLSGVINISMIFPGLSKIFLFIDAIIYAILEGAIRLTFVIGSQDFGGLTKELTYLMKNLNSLVGIFIMFKISLLFIQYLVEPDTFKDKSKGGEAVIKNVVVVLILLVLLRSGVLFGVFNDIQKVVFGTGDYEVLQTFGIEPPSENTDMIQRIVFGGSLGNPAHTITVKIFEQFLFKFEGDYLGLKEFTPLTWDSGTANANIFDAGSVFATIANSNYGMSFFHLLTGLNIFNSFSQVHYSAIISSAFGIYMIIRFMKMGLTLVVRFFKLFLMQVISPIAIVSYATPDGKKTFNNFWKTYFDIYMELFIRLFVTYISIYLMGKFLNSITSYGVNLDVFSRLILSIIVLVAVTKFMDEVPNLISSVFGMKIDNPKQKSVGAILGGVVGSGISMGARTAGALAAGRGIGSALGAGLMGIPGGFSAGSNASNVGDFTKKQIENFSGSYGKGYNVGTSGGNIAAMQTGINKSLGIDKVKADGMQKVIDANTTMSKNTGGMKSATEDAVSKLFGKKGMDGYKERNAQMQQLNETIKESSTDGMMFRNSSGGYISMDSFSKLSNTEAQGYSAVTTQELIEERSDLDKKLTDEYKEMVDERLGRNYDTFENLSEKDRTKLLNGYDVLDSTGNKIDISIEEAVAFQQYHNDYTTQQKELPSEYKDEFKKLFNVSRGSNGKYKTNEKQATAEYNTNARNMKVEKDKLNN